MSIGGVRQHRRRRLQRDERGTFMIELALALPVLLVLLLTGVEFTRFVLVNQKVERTSASLADLVSQSAVITEAGMNNLFQAAKFVMEPFDVPSQGKLIVTSVAAAGGPARIKWQRSYGSGAGNSAFGAQGAVATLPDGLIVRDGENLILCETFFRYEPVIFQEIIGKTDVHRFAAFRPRYCAFANDLPDNRKCSAVLVGIRDDGSCAGLPVDDALLKRLAGLRDEGKILPFPVMTVEKRSVGGCDVAAIIVAPSDNPPLKVDGRVWVRIGPTTRTASAADEHRLLVDRIRRIEPCLSALSAEAPGVPVGFQPDSSE